MVALAATYDPINTMKKSLIRFAGPWILCAAILNAAPVLLAQTTNKVPRDKSAATEPQKPAKAGPFHGKLVAVDKVAKTITVGKRTFQITSESKLKKNGKPATLEAAVIGETASGYVKPSPDGKLVATTVNFGPKPAGESGEKPKSAPGTSEKQK